MSIFLGILTALVGILLVLVTAVLPVKQPYTRAELNRRVARSVSPASEIDRFRAYASLTTLLRMKQAVLLVLLVLLLVALLGWGYGVLSSIIVALLFPLVARIKIVQAGAQNLYHRVESQLVAIALKYKRIVLFFREPSLAIKELPKRVYSNEDLAETVSHSEDVIGANQRALLSAALVFFDTPVSTIMTPRKSVKTIKKSEFLGPLVLDELHNLGHSRLPVIADSIDRVVGILHLRELLSLDVRHSVTAERAMDKKVHYINQKDNLEQALAGFVQHRHHFYIVVDDEMTTVGILTLEDTMRALVGRDIVDGHVDH